MHSIIVAFRECMHNASSCSVPPIAYTVDTWICLGNLSIKMLRAIDCLCCVECEKYQVMVGIFFKMAE